MAKKPAKPQQTGWRIVSYAKSNRWALLAVMEWGEPQLIGVTHATLDAAQQAMREQIQTIYDYDLDGRLVKGRR